MDRSYLVTVTAIGGSGRPVFQFAATGGFDRANYLAGVAVDAMHDESAALFDWRVEPLPTVAPGDTLSALLRAARNAAP